MVIIALIVLSDASMAAGGDGDPRKVNATNVIAFRPQVNRLNVPSQVTSLGGVPSSNQVLHERVEVPNGTI